PTASAFPYTTFFRSTAPWISLIVAGLFEIGWPVGVKIAQTPGRALLGISIAVVGMARSGWLLWMAQKDIPIGTAYAVWTGSGARSEEHTSELQSREK